MSIVYCVYGCEGVHRTNVDHYLAVVVYIAVVFI
jgi:hypothetical protein